MTKDNFNPKGKVFKQRLQACLDDAKTTYKISIGQDSGRTVTWQTKHHVAHMFLYNQYKSTKPEKYHLTKKTISWDHFSDPKIVWSTIKQADFLRSKKIQPLLNLEMHGKLALNQMKKQP